MFNYYHLNIGNGSQYHTLTYRLREHRPAQLWAELMSNAPLSKLRKLKEIWYGVPLDIAPFVDELMGLVDELNQWLPEKITYVWDSNNLQGSVNLFHTHFPEHKDDKDPIHRQQLERYNDIIHYIENIDRTRYNQRIKMYLLVNTPKVEIESDDYQYFTMEHNFGDLQLGYPHIGRHATEIMYANDVNVPTDQILPQHSINGFHWCRFDDPTTHNRQFEKFKLFYHSSKIKWPYALDDPRLALGHLTIGNLETVDGQDLTKGEILSRIMPCKQVLGWSFT